MARVSTYLNFAGTTEQAFEFYRAVFGGAFNGPIHRFSEVPASPGQPPIAEADRNLVMHVELPIAGMMSDEPAEIVAAKSQRVLAAMVQCGCTVHNAMIQHMFAALPTIPELRLTDLGLVDVRSYAFTELFV